MGWDDQMRDLERIDQVHVLSGEMKRMGWDDESDNQMRDLKTKK